LSFTIHSFSIVILPESICSKWFKQRNSVDFPDPVHKSFSGLNQYADNVTALLDLTNQRLDAVVVDEVVGRYYVAKKPNQYRVLDDNFGQEQYGIGFNKNNTELQQKIQHALDSMQADGCMAKISQKWFGKDVTK